MGWVKQAGLALMLAAILAVVGLGLLGVQIANPVVMELDVGDGNPTVVDVTVNPNWPVIVPLALVLLAGIICWRSPPPSGRSHEAA